MATVKFVLLVVAIVCVSEINAQGECFNPFYQPPWCYGGFGRGFGSPFGFGGGFGYPGFGAYSGFGFPGARGFGGGVGTGVGFSTSFGGEGEERPSKHRPKGPRVKSGRPIFDEGFEDEFGPDFGPDFGFAGPGFGAGFGGGFGGPYGGPYGGFGFGAPFGGFGFGQGFNPYIPPIPTTLKSSGPGFRTTSGSTTYSFGPGGKTTTSTSNQLVTTEADDGTWTIQSSGLPMQTDVDEGTILVIASVGKPTKMDKEVVGQHEIQYNFSYKDEPKKWVNLKVSDKGPNVSGVTVEQKGDRVYIRGPNNARKPEQRRGAFR